MKGVGGWLSEIDAHWHTCAVTHVLARAHARAHAPSEHRPALPKSDSFRSTPVCVNLGTPCLITYLGCFSKLVFLHLNALFIQKRTFISSLQMERGTTCAISVVTMKMNVMKIKQHRHLQRVVEQVAAARSRLSDCNGDRRVIS